VADSPDETLLRDTIAGQPNNVTARHRLAELLLEEGRVEEALSESHAGMLYVPDHPGLLGISVMAAELSGQVDLASRYSRLLAVLNDDSLRSDPSMATSASGLRWGRRRSDRIGDQELIDLSDPNTNLNPNARIDPPDPLRHVEPEREIRYERDDRDSFGDGRSEPVNEAREPQKDKESRWSLPRRFRPSKTPVPIHQVMATSSTKSLADVAGMTDVKWRLQGLLSAASGGVGVHTGGVMLFGPAGCGKSHIAEAVAGQLGARMVQLNLTDVVDAGDHDGTELIRSAFALARQSAPCVLILEDLDVLSDQHKMHARRIDLLAMRLAMKLDEALGARDLTIVGLTNSPWRVDPALRAPGRLERALFVPPPDLLARGRILVDRLSFLPLGPDVSPGELAVETEGLSARELVSICSAAAEHALCVTKHSGAMWSLQHRDLRRALDRIEPQSRDWFVSAHGALRTAGSEVDPVYDYIRRHVRRL
jgi:SpoVK/Ycf46/Vps4 family AAA+-type ATPase